MFLRHCFFLNVRKTNLNKYQIKTIKAPEEDEEEKIE
jgi:hypothetical protein